MKEHFTAEVNGNCRSCARLLDEICHRMQEAAKLKAEVDKLKAEISRIINDDDKTEIERLTNRLHDEIRLRESRDRRRLGMKDNSYGGSQ